jgi:hypothetical protein
MGSGGLLTLGHHTAMVMSRERLRAAGIHLGISLCIAAAAALLVFAAWYPYPYREVSGGRELFLIVTTVDVILGPLITLAIFNRQKKSVRELTMDLTIVGLVQIAALAYGLWTVAVARPVHLVFEFDRMRVVHAVEIPEELLGQAPPGITAEPWTGPTAIAVRPFRNHEERVAATMQALQGVQLGARPDLWETYDAARQRIAAAARPVADLQRKLPAQAPAIDAALQRLGRDAATTSYLPMNSRKLAWTVFLDPKTADIVGYAPVDSF